MDIINIVDHPIYLLTRVLPILLAVLAVVNWWYVVFIYNDIKKRNINNKLFWSVLAYFLGPWILPLYNAITKRPQATFSGSITGAVLGEKLEKTGKRGKFFLSAVSLLWLGVFVFTVIKDNKDFISFLSGKNAQSYIIFGFLAPIILLLYSLPWKANTFDRPLWGMKETSQGYLIDESLTKHRKAVIGLTVFIFSIPILFIIYIWISLKLGY